MPSCLRELFEQTSCEEDKRFANNAHSSAKSYKSILAVSGMQLPPPLVRTFLLIMKFQSVDFPRKKASKQA